MGRSDYIQWNTLCVVKLYEINKGLDFKWFMRGNTNLTNGHRNKVVERKKNKKNKNSEHICRYVLLRDMVKDATHHPDYKVSDCCIFMKKIK